MYRQQVYRLLLQRFAAVWALVVASRIVSPASAGPGPAPDPHEITKRVLLIGNSYTAQTYQSLAQFAEADEDLELRVNIAAWGGANLAFHYTNREIPIYWGWQYSLVDMLRLQPWDYVVLQDLSTGPTRIGDVQLFMDTAQAMTDLIRAEAPTAQVLYFLTWARRSDNILYQSVFADPQDMQSELRTNYSAAATATNGAVVPVGNAWETAYALRPYDPSEPQETRFSLHISDGSHPSAEGRYLTGAVFFETIFGRSASSSTYLGGLTCSRANFLRRMASQATGVPLGAVPAALCCDGDADGNGLVNFGDLAAVLSDFGDTGYATPGDVNVDGRVDFGDLALVLSRFGTSCR